MSNSWWPHGLQHARFLCPLLSPRVCSNAYPLSRQCYLTISSSIVPFSSCPQSFPASGSFPVSQLFTSCGQSIGASAIVLPMNIRILYHWATQEAQNSWRKSTPNIHWEDCCWCWSPNTLATTCEELTHWKRPWCWERLRAGGERDDGGWDGWIASPTRGHEFGWTLGVGDGQEGLACCNSWGRKESDMTERLNWTELKKGHAKCQAGWSTS